jgi:hypothetical protein
MAVVSAHEVGRMSIAGVASVSVVVASYVAAVVADRVSNRASAEMAAAEMAATPMAATTTVCGECDGRKRQAANRENCGQGKD